MGGEEFLAPFRAAASGRAGAVHPRHRGLDPQPEHHRGRGLLDLVRQRPRHGAAVDRELVDRPPRPEGLGGGGGRHLRRLRRHPRHGGQPDGCHGVGRLPRLGLPVRRGPPDREHPRLPRAAGELHGDPDLAPLPRGGHRARASARRHAAPAVDVQHQRARRLRPGRLLRAGRSRPGLQRAQVPDQARLLGAGGQLQRAQARLGRRRRGMSQRRWDLHRLHHAGLPRLVHAVHERTDGRQPRPVGGTDQGVRRLRPPDASDHRHGAEPRTGVASQRAPADQRLRAAPAPARNRHDDGRSASRPRSWR